MGEIFLMSSIKARWLSKNAPPTPRLFVFALSSLAQRMNVSDQSRRNFTSWRAAIVGGDAAPRERAARSPADRLRLQRRLPRDMRLRPRCGVRDARTSDRVETGHGRRCRTALPVVRR